jgi:hypothetical protein
MSKLELITVNELGRIEEIGPELAATYKIAFAGPPWNEVSRCINAGCSVSYLAEEAGCNCQCCGKPTVEAYSTDQLIENWQEDLREGGIIEVAYLNGDPQRATIARPTNPSELFERKYQVVTEMKDWLANRLPSELVWIEDTFANRDRQATSNLAQRGQTLKRVADYYGGMQIATRTLSEAIVASTLRDLRGVTATYIGGQGVGSSIVNSAFGNPGYDLPTVPDRRTLLRVNLGGGF